MSRRPEPAVRRRITPRGWAVAALAAVLLALPAWPARLVPAPAASALGAALAAACALAWWRSGARLARLGGEWRVAACVPLDEEVAVGALLRLPGGAPPFTLHATDPATRRERPVLRLAGLADGDLRPGWSARFVRRGAVPLPPLAATCTQPFGLVEARRRLGSGAEVVVLPAAGALRRPFAVRLAAWLEADAQGAEPGLEEPDHLRPYRPGDPPRAVHWRASARARRLLVAERCDPAGRHLRLVLDTGGGPGPRFEILVCAAATLVDDLARRGCRLSLHGGFAPDGLAGDAQALRERLATVVPDGVPLAAVLPGAGPAVCLCARRPEGPAGPGLLLLDPEDCAAAIHLPRRLRGAAA